jgi:hypothetical protein
MKRPTKSTIIKSGTLTSGARITSTIHGFVRRFGHWPTAIHLDPDMVSALREHTFTEVGWQAVEDKLAVRLDVEGTVIAVDADGNQFEYDADHTLPPDDQRADLWIWGVKLLQ